MGEMLIQKLAEEGRIIRGTWSDTDEQGRQLLCLYTALAGAPDARPEDCPASLCPQWLAHLLPWMDDSGTEAAWPPVVRRVAALAPRLGELSSERGDRLRSRWLVTVLDEGLSHAPEGDHVPAVMGVRALLVRHGGGAVVTAEGWDKAAAAAWAAADAAAWAAAAAARAAVGAAWAAARAAVGAAWAAARAAARAAVGAAWDAAAAAAAAARAAADAAWAAARAAAGAAWDAARRNCADRLTNSLLTMLEEELADG